MNTTSILSQLQHYHADDTIEYHNTAERPLSAFLTLLSSALGVSMLFQKAIQFTSLPFLHVSLNGVHVVVISGQRSSQCILPSSLTIAHVVNLFCLLSQCTASDLQITSFPTSLTGDQFSLTLPPEDICLSKTLILGKSEL